MTKLFENMTNDGLEEAQDRLGGGFLLETDAYEAVIKVAYAGQSQGGARNVTIVAEAGGKEYRETIYFTNKKGENFFLNKDDNTKKVPLPGFTLIDDLCLVATGEGLAAQETEEKQVKVWDSEQKKEVPKAVPVLTALIGKKVGLTIVKSTVNVNEKVGNDYVPTAKTRDENNIDKVFDIDSRMTVAEARDGREAGFIDAWVEKNKGQTRDKTTKADNDNGRTGRPGAAPQAGSAPAGTRSLFGAKKAAG